jgi:hypothetical protein
VIEQVVEFAEFALDELYGLRDMAEQRPDDDQFASFLVQVAAGRAANGFTALPPVSRGSLETVFEPSSVIFTA